MDFSRNYDMNGGIQCTMKERVMTNSAQTAGTAIAHAHLLFR